MGLSQLLTAWLLQHYALAVWLSTGVNTRRRKPAPLDKLMPFIYTAITGQVLSVYQSIVFLLAGRSMPTSILVLGIVSVVVVLLVWILPWLELRTKRAGVPTLFNKLTEGHRRRYAWTAMLLFWTVFFGFFAVITSLN